MARKVLDKTLFKTLFLQNSEQLRNFLYYKTGNLAWAEDIMQESFLSLWNARRKIDPTKAKSFLYTTANNKFLDAARHQKVVLKHREQLPPDRHTETPQHLMEQTEFRQRLEAAIQDLTEKQRAVFLMNRIEKRTYKEIAELMGVSQKAIEKLMHKALSHMRKLDKKI